MALSSAKAQELSTIDTKLKHLAKVTSSYPQEKIHLHFDKPYYVIGEDIWFKAYTVIAERNEPSQLSKVLYVDLIDESKAIKRTITLPIENGLAKGNINLADSLNEGIYRIRAYTNYMRNYDSSFFFEKTVEIGHVASEKKASLETKKSLKFEAFFFPEGGSLLAGVRNKVGVKILTADGFGANMDGYIVDEKNEQVAFFKTEHAGMGVFAFSPQQEQVYRAVLTTADGKTSSFALPKALNSGYSLNVNSTNENIRIGIFCSKNLINSSVHLVAQTNGVVVSTFPIKMDNASVVANIPTSTFLTGIVQLTLFDANFAPIAERLLFVNHNDQLNLELSNRLENVVMGKAQISLNVKDKQNNYIDGSFSVAVTDATKVKIDEDDETTILSNLLLTSDLKGYIEKPNYYFNNVDEGKLRHLDNLMLTQGWRRFTWADIIAKKEPEINFRPEQSFEITGKITGLNNKPLPNAKVNLFSTTPGLILNLDTISDIKGNFVFDRLDLSDSSSFILQAKTDKNSKAINLIAMQKPTVTNEIRIGNTVDITPYIVATKERFVELSKFNKLDKGILLKSVTITSAKPKSNLNIPNSANTSGVADYVITQEDLAKETSIIFPISRAPGWLGLAKMIADDQVVIIIDGIEVPGSELSAIPIQNIAGIELVTRNYNLAIYATGRIKRMFVTTKSGKVSSSPATNTANLKNIGLSAAKEFYSPNYDDPKTDRQAKDMRSTIYWNPNLNTDITGKASFSFFNASTPGTYRVVVEGMDNFGNLGRKVFNYEVK
ncbi:MAG: carboxypeptidase regulatory-like domain-containing protein [Pedobacter sp.]|nr:MAG: carboxypeptidase regulatory-like domain-containing protein [Pedobacter sp.]